jgi:hypothetical protein
MNMGSAACKKPASFFLSSSFWSGFQSALESRKHDKEKFQEPQELLLRSSSYDRKPPAYVASFSTARSVSLVEKHTP